MKKYQIIYADPPWKYDFSRSASREIENHYPTMSIQDMEKLNIPSENNSVLFMWATAPKLENALRIMKSWDFVYKSCAIWDKEIIGMGYWFRGQHEILLVGVRGKFSPPPQSLRVSSVFRKRRTKHSEKPNNIRDLIKSWYPTSSRIELFARQKIAGWDVWGDEVVSNISLDSKNDS